MLTSTPRDVSPLNPCEEQKLGKGGQEREQIHCLLARAEGAIYAPSSAIKKQPISAHFARPIGPCFQRNSTCRSSLAEVTSPWPQVVFVGGVLAPLSPRDPVYLFISPPCSLLVVSLLLTQLFCHVMLPPPPPPPKEKTHISPFLPSLSSSSSLWLSHAGVGQKRSRSSA